MMDIIKGAAIGLGIVAVGAGIASVVDRLVTVHELDHAAHREKIYHEIDKDNNRY